jgi:uncharacterized membrane protein YhhN
VWTIDHDGVTVTAPTSPREPVIVGAHSTGLRAAFVPFVVVAIAHLVLLVLADGPLGAAGVPAAAALAGATKPLLMPALLLALLIASPQRRSGPVAVGATALVLSWIGDISLGTPDGPGFLVGLVFFLLAHVAWIVLISRFLLVRRPPVAGLAYALWWIVFVVLLAPHTGPLLVPVAVYGLVLATVAALALGSSPVVAAGAGLFVVSDSLLGLHVFVPGLPTWQTDAAIMLAYLAAQGLIVLGTVVHVRGGHAGGRRP